MTIEKKSGIGSKCICELFSCGAAVKTVENVKVYDPDRRFRFIKNEEGSICDGGFVDGGIDSCQIRIDRSNGITKPADIPVARPKKVESLIEYKKSKHTETEILVKDEVKIKVKTKGTHIPSLNIVDLESKAGLSEKKKIKVANSNNQYCNSTCRYSLSRI